MLSRKVSGIVLSVLLLFSMTNFSIAEKRNERKSIGLAYVTFGSISISGDTDLIQTASTNGWNGNGSQSAPIIIEGYNITTDPAISLTNTRLHVVIRDMVLQDAGISLTNVSNVMFDSVEVMSTGSGVLVDNSTKVTMTNMTITNQLRVFESNGITVMNSIIKNVTGTVMGISVESSSGVSVTGTTVSNVSKSGISISGSDNVTLTGVNISQTGENGLFVISSQDIKVNGLQTGGGIGINDVAFQNSNNTEIDGITSWGPQGASIMDMFNSNNTLIRNVIANNSFGAIYLRNSENLTLENSEIQNSQNHGVRVHMVKGFAMTGVTVRNSAFSGTYITNSTDVAVTDVDMMETNQTGFLIDFSEGVALRDSTAIDNLNYGILLRGSANALLSNLTAIGNGMNATLFSGIGAESSENVTIEMSKAATNKYAGILVGGKNITLSDNEVWGNANHGITGNGVDGLIIQENTIRDNLEHGIFFVNGNNQEYVNNTVSGNQGYGIHPSVGENLTIAGNFVTNSGDYGIFVNSITFTDVSDNIVENSSTKGMVIRLSGNVTAKYNTVFASDEEGILVETTVNSSLSSNNLIQNSGGGVKIIGISANVTIAGNNFVENGNPQGEDNSTGMLWKGNYWSDLTKPDADNDGIVDIAYDLSGTANATDMEPLTMVTDAFDRYDYMLAVILLTPIGGEKLNESITISWEPAIVGMDLPVTYSLDYSSDGGTSWTPIIAATTGTSYEWETFDVPNGSYQIRLTATAGNRMRETISGSFTVTNIHKLSSLEITTPSADEKVTGTITIAWTPVEDSFPHSITYTVEYSLDGGTSWKAIASGINGTSITWDVSEMPNGNVLIRVTASDMNGLSVEAVRSIVINNPVQPTTNSTSVTDKGSEGNNLLLPILVAAIVGFAGIAAFVFRKRIADLIKK
ncbi:MAG: hypothetical protein D6732_14180 [Methanobacteriota archaeon]|nr:MAG: hypothetical protein D6732_14180 [Euryarchaeota archaeon]